MTSVGFVSDVLIEPRKLLEDLEAPVFRASSWMILDDHLVKWLALSCNRKRTFRVTSESLRRTALLQTPLPSLWPFT